MLITELCSKHAFMAGYILILPILTVKLIVWLQILMVQYSVNKWLFVTYAGFYEPYLRLKVKFYIYYFI